MKVHVQVVACDGDFCTELETDASGYGTLLMLAAAGPKKAGCTPLVRVHEAGRVDPLRDCDLPGCAPVVCQGCGRAAPVENGRIAWHLDGDAGCPGQGTPVSIVEGGRSA